MTDADIAHRRAAWSRYWSHGFAHTLEGSFDSGYSGVIADFWRRAAGSIPDARVLDLATGNGAIAGMIASLLPRAAIDAVDCAALTPALPQDLLARVRFHAGTTAEALPFPDGSFDLVTSQYGFEYTDFRRSVPELRRVMAPSAGVAMVMHHAHSALSAVARDEVVAYDWLLADGHLLDRAEAVIPFAALAGRGEVPPADADGPRRDYNQTLRLLAATADTLSAPDALLEARTSCAHMIGEALRSGRSEVALEQLRGYREDLEDARLRSRELLDCALGVDGRDALIDRLGQAGIQTLECLELREGVHLLGWALLGRG